MTAPGKRMKATLAWALVSDPGGAIGNTIFGTRSDAVWHRQHVLAGQLKSPLVWRIARVRITEVAPRRGK
jgi:hypothetical protein